MPRLFTGLEIPPDVAETLSSCRGGLHGARWIDRENYHVTLRFIGDVSPGIADEVADLLAESRPREPLALEIDALSVFGGDRPRAIVARVVATGELARLQAEQERLMRQVGLDPETRKYVPHVTLARLRQVSASDAAGYLATRGHVPRLRFTAARVVLYSARGSVGGGPYVVEAAYPLDAAPAPAGPPEAGATPRPPAAIAHRPA